MTADSSSNPKPRQTLSPAPARAGLAPSILSSDFLSLGEQIREAEEAGAEVIHVDVMDGQFVPNITMGQAVTRACRRATQLPLDVHMMVDRPERMVEEFAEAGASVITVHAEATRHVHRTIQLIRATGVEAGLALNPLTPLDFVRDALPYVDLVLLMTVNPGFGGQEFIQRSPARIRTVREWANDLNPACRIEVDGGINPSTAPLVVEAGADLLVAGSSVFNDRGSVTENMAALRQAVG